MAAILTGGLAGVIQETDGESSYIPSDEDEDFSNDDDLPTDKKNFPSDLEDLVVPNRNEDDRVVPNDDQASGNPVNDAIIVFGSD